jgi:hypothetical protein
VNGIESLRGSLKKDIDRFDVESKKHKRLYRLCQTAVIVVTATTTIVAGAGLILPESSGKAAQFSVLCLTTITAAVTAWAEMRRVRDLWQHEREVYYALIDIQRVMEFVAANRELTPLDLEGLFQRIAAVLGSSSQKWARIQEKKDVITIAPVAPTPAPTLLAAPHAPRPAPSPLAGVDPPPGGGG